MFATSIAYLSSHSTPLDFATQNLDQRCNGYTPLGSFGNEPDEGRPRQASKHGCGNLHPDGGKHPLPSNYHHYFARTIAKLRRLGH